MASRREVKRVQKERAKWLRRTCIECGHSWVLPRDLAGAGRTAAKGALLSGNTTSAAIIGQRTVEFERCVKCGSVRYYRQTTLETDDPAAQ